MKSFEYHHAGEIIFGNGRISEVGSVVGRYGERCLIVSGPRKGALRDLYPIVGDLLEHGGLRWEHFDGVTPNPTVELVSAGAKLARRFQADVVLGIGGGSSLDAAKAIAVEATHEGSSWDYLFFKRKPSSRTLPVIAVTTTSGSGQAIKTKKKKMQRSISALFGDTASAPIFQKPRFALRLGVDSVLHCSVRTSIQLFDKCGLHGRCGYH